MSIIPIMIVGIGIDKYQTTELSFRDSDAISIATMISGVMVFVSLVLGARAHTKK